MDMKVYPRDLREGDQVNVHGTRYRVESFTESVKNIRGHYDLAISFQGEDWVHIVSPWTVLDIVR